MDMSTSSFPSTTSATPSAYAGNAAAQKAAPIEAPSSKPISEVRVSISVRGDQQMRAGSTPESVSSSQTSVATNNVAAVRFAPSDQNRDGAVSTNEAVSFETRRVEQTYGAIQQLGKRAE